MRALGPRSVELQSSGARHRTNVPLRQHAIAPA